MITRRAALAAMSGTAALRCLAEGSSTPIELPARLGRNREILIPVRVNGSEPIWCLLDTGGANALYLRPAKAAELGIAATSTTMSAGGLDTQSVANGRAVVTLDAGDVHRANQQLYIKDFQSRDDGVIGAAVFAAYIVELDFLAPAVRLHPPASFHDRDHGVPIPIELWSFNPQISAALAIDDREPVTARLTVDSGAGGLADAFLTPRFQQRLERQGRTIAWKAEKDGWSSCRIRRIAVGTAAMDNPFVVMTPVQGFGGDGNAPDGMLAINFLRRYRLFLDYSNERLWLEPNP
jgi:hypothetical protein